VEHRDRSRQLPVQASHLRSLPRGGLVETGNDRMGMPTSSYRQMAIRDGWSRSIRTRIRTIPSQIRLRPCPRSRLTARLLAGPAAEARKAVQISAGNDGSHGIGVGRKQSAAARIVRHAANT
jgi:hypothetical protein